MAEVTNGQLQMSAQEIQNNLEQVSKNKTTIENINNKLSSLTGVAVISINVSGTDVVEFYRSNYEGKNIIINNILFMVKDIEFFYTINNSGVIQYSISNREYKETIIDFTNVKNLETQIKRLQNTQFLNITNNTILSESDKVDYYRSITQTEKNSMIINGTLFLCFLEEPNYFYTVTSGGWTRYSFNQEAYKEVIINFTNIYTKEQVNELVKRKVCSLSSIDYTEGEITTNSDGTQTRTYTIVSNESTTLSDEYTDMVSYGPIILSFEGTGNFDLKFTTFVNNNITDSYSWEVGDATKNYKVVFDITTASLTISGTEDNIEWLSEQDLPTTITFKYL